jgi:hypothetical protein
MRRHSPFLVVPLAVSILASAGCGRPATPSSSARNVDVKPVASTPVSASARRSASKELARAWPFERPSVAVYADLEGLLKTKLFGGLVTTVLTLAGGQLPAPQRKCIDVALDSWKEIAFGIEDKHELALIRFDPAAQKATATCMGAAFAAEKVTTLPGASEAWVSGRDEVAALSPGLIAVGTRQNVTAALDGKGRGTTLAGLGLGADEYLTLTANLPEEGVVARGTLLASDNEFRIAVDAELPSGALAQKVEAGLGGGALKGHLGEMGPMKGEEGKLLGRLVDAFTVQRDGKFLKVSFDLKEPVEEQARDIGALAALSIAGVRKYLTNAKEAEARATVGVIAKDLAMSFAVEDGKAAAKKKLTSLPPVPKTVPRGTKVQTSPGDWQAWSAIRFSMDSPQYYQYEVKAAKDGESAEVIARGDLNGDGKTSQFKVSVKVRRPDNVLVIAPSIEETDPGD